MPLARHCNTDPVDDAKQGAAGGALDVTRLGIKAFPWPPVEFGALVRASVEIHAHFAVLLDGRYAASCAVVTQA